jgi:hypothetical protein
MRRPTAILVGTTILLVVAACGAGAAPASPAPTPLAATASNGWVRITMTLAGPPRNDGLSWVDVVIENTARRGVRWAGGGCGDPGGTYIDLNGAFDFGRADWPALLGAYKRLAVGGNDPRTALPLDVGYVPESRLGTDLACTADLRIETLAVGGALRYRAGWDGTFNGGPAPSGPATVSAVFPYIGLDGLVPADAFDSTPVVAAIRTAVGGEGVAGGLAPGRLIDLALADPQFAAFVQAQPQATWINPDVARIEGTWHVGLFRSSAGQDLYGGVLIDGHGAVVGHRFDP